MVSTNQVTHLHKLATTQWTLGGVGEREVRRANNRFVVDL